MASHENRSRCGQHQKASLNALYSHYFREILRARGLNPGGGIEDLRIKLKENMEATGDFSLTTAGEDNLKMHIF